MQNILYVFCKDNYFLSLPFGMFLPEPGVLIPIFFKMMFETECEILFKNVFFPVLLLCVRKVCKRRAVLEIIAYLYRMKTYMLT